MSQATVCFLIKGGDILLARKKRKIAEGLWNGYGGFREESDDSLEETAIREMEEEIGVSAKIENLEKIAIISYTNKKEDGRLRDIEVHFYLVRHWVGTPRSSEEMYDPRWFSIKTLPFDEMMPSDSVWLSRALQGKKIKGAIVHNEKKEVVLSDMQEVSVF